MITGLMRVKNYGFLDMLLCVIQLPQLEEYVAQVSIGRLDRYGLIRVPDEYVSIDLYSLIMVALLD
jgi:hypothetical protein